MERLLTHLFVPGEDHPDYPEENNIIPGHQHIVGIEVIEILRLLGPSQGRKGPQCRGKPGIQRIRILRHMGAAALRALAGILSGYHDLAALIAIVGRDPVPPPELPGNAPVTDVIRPVEVRLLHTLRQQLDITLLYGLHSRLDKFIHLHKPLLLYHGLHGSLAAVMGTHVMGMRNHLHQKSKLLQFLHHPGSGLIAIHPLILPAILVDGSIVI